MLTDPVDLKFPVSSPANLKLNNVSGSVVIHPVDEDVIHVIAIKQPDSGDVEHTIVECTQSDDGEVSVATKFPDHAINLLRGMRVCDVDYIVKVPTHTNIEIKVVSSEVKVSGIIGDLTLKTVSGDIQLDSISGQIDVESVSGDIVGSGLTGISMSKTVSGDIGISNAAFNQVKFHSTSGDLVMETNLGDGPYHFNTVSGDVILKLPQKNNAEIVLKSLSGSLRTNLQVQKSNQSNGRQTVIIGKGGTQITMNSVSGDLSVSSPEETQGRSSYDISDIISKIDKGDLTVEQALEQLNG
jgi:hypothetical protein